MRPQAINEKHLETLKPGGSVWDEDRVCKYHVPELVDNILVALVTT